MKFYAVQTNWNCQKKTMYHLNQPRGLCQKCCSGGYGVARKDELRYALSPNNTRPSFINPPCKQEYKSLASKAMQSEEAPHV
mmetsp:Transcript_10856/g.22970  ORF Transcript_10856/g.22970 Transcript_10856/m.22970 type:complete len:82 (-) Transcript_10856:738-983(-)